MTEKSKAWYSGYDAKVEEINEMGWIASRDKFNMDYPVGQKWNGSVDGLAYSHGEYKALCDKMSG